MKSEDNKNSGKARTFGKRTVLGQRSKIVPSRPVKIRSSSVQNLRHDTGLAASSERVERSDDGAVEATVDVAATPGSDFPEISDETSAPPSSTSKPSSRARPERPFIYVCAFLVFTGLCMAGIWRGNQLFAPEMYDSTGPVAYAKAFTKGQNFATFDLNINIRDIRNQQIARFKKAPEIAVLGASHWQEAHTELLPKMDFYNAHVHRDYYEDMLAVVEMFVRHDKLPPKMIIAIRDRLFTPVADRTDFLWLPGIPYYQAMARRLGLEPHPYWETMPVQRWRELISTKMLYSNASRWFKADVKPHATPKNHFETLDIVRPGGSIYWSGEHQKIFTPERSERLSIEFAVQNFDSPPKIDPKGVQTIDRLLAFLKKNNVEVALVHPPFNPIYYDRVKDGAYRVGLKKIEQITLDYAKKYDFKVFGSFDPAKVGCTADMYIDAEHSNPVCLGKVLNEYTKVVAPKPVSEGLEAPVSVPVVSEKESAIDAIKPTIIPPVAALDVPTVADRGQDEKPVAKQLPVVSKVHSSKSQESVASIYPPLPLRRPTRMPPLPARNPFFASSDCVGHGSWLQRSSKLKRPLGGTVSAGSQVNAALKKAEQSR